VANIVSKGIQGGRLKSQGPMRVRQAIRDGSAGAHHWESPKHAKGGVHAPVSHGSESSDLHFAKHAKCEALGTDLKRELVINVINYQIHHGLGNRLATFTASTI
jgi:hypothetical protein